LDEKPRSVEELGFQEEWEQCLDGEVSDVTADQTLPLVLPRHQVGEHTQVEDRLGLALRTLYVGALRPSELFALRSPNLRPDGLWLNDRLVPLDPVTIAALSSLALIHPELFGGRKAELEAQLAETPLARHYQEGGRTLRLTAFRHACATHLLENGMDLFVLHALLGHQNLGCTRQYLQMAVGLRGAEYARCHPLMARQRALPHWRGVDLPALGEEGQDEPVESRVATPTVDEVLQILETAPTLRDRAMLRAYYATGLRLNELLNCNCSDLDDQELRIFVRTGKRDKDRYVLIDPLTRSWLRQWGGVKGKLIGIKASRAGEIFRQCADRHGLRAKYAQQGLALTVHSLRHAFASHLYAHDMPMASIKRLMGHDRLATTVLYLECPWERCLQQYAHCQPLGASQ